MIEIIVRGLPAPQGSKRAVKRKDGKVSVIEMSKAVGPWREAIRTETQKVMMGHLGMSGAVSVAVWFYLPRPKGHYRTGRNANLLRDGAPGSPAGTPDLDKLVRAVLDGLTMGGAWKDDGQVVRLRTGKYYADACAPGCRIEITEVAG